MKPLFYKYAKTKDGLSEMVDLYVTDKQLLKIREIGFNKHFGKPTVANVHRWIRTSLGIGHCRTTRHMDNDDIRYSIWHYIAPIDSMNIDISEGRYDESDGVIDTLDEAESSALDFSLDFILSKGGVEGYNKWLEETEAARLEWIKENKKKKKG